MAGRLKGTDRLAQLLAAATAGVNMEPSPSRGPSGPNKAMEVLAALGMSRASTWGAMILLASYQNDPQALNYCLQRGTRFVWHTWLATADPNHTVTTRQIRKLVEMAMGHHINPAKARRHSLVWRAKYLGVNHKTFTLKFKKPYECLMAELQYQEGEAARALTRRL